MLNDGEGERVDYPSSSGSFLLPHLPLIEEAREKGIKHVGHQHPLKFKEDVRNGFESEVHCDGCSLEIGRSGGFSCCMEECSFNLHEFCASLPKEMKDYPQHPQHPLILYTHSPYPKNSGFECNVCNNHSETPFFYHCDICMFNVDLKCASMSFLVCPRNLHKHELTAQLHPLSFLCSFCGEIHWVKKFSMISYRCKTCSFWIHEQCYSLPQSIEHDSHVHSLKLGHIQGKPHKNLCGICKENINNKLGFYVCKRCNYYVHINCVTREWYPILETLEDQTNDKLIQFPLASNEVVRNTLAQFIKNICHWKDAEDKNGDNDILNHPSHNHPLTLEFDLSKFTNFNYTSTNQHIRDYEVCNGCILPLILNDAPFYSCNRSTCNFVLHRWCAKLPRELKHPAHTYKGHTLILQKKVEFFTCKGCQQIGNGFAYKCNKCYSYYMDVRCAALPRLVNHETHKHPLTLKYGRNIGGCFSCGESNFFEDYDSNNFSYCSTLSDCPTYLTFGCDACNLSIHPKCLILPREIVHWYDEHGFKLIDSTHVSTISTSNGNIPQLVIIPFLLKRSLTQGASEYHCEFCEWGVYQNRWIYHCFECDQCIDVDCVRELLGLFPYPVKFDGLFKFWIHYHPLICIIMTEDDNKFVCSCCNTSLCNIFGICFECTECQIRYSMKCVGSEE